MALDSAISSPFAGYRLDELVARGGMGVVYRATELASGRDVALKLILPDLAEDRLFRRRFEREARLSAELDHPHAIPVYEAGECDGHLFLAMKFVDGTDLRSTIAWMGHLHPRRAALIVSQVAAALDAAHERGLIHRDVKPDNVLLEARESGVHSYLTDFGLSKLTSSQSGLTRTGRWVGTVDYAAPEQVQAAEVDARCDIYALGCVLYEALTGTVPYPRPREVQKILAHISDPVPSVAAISGQELEAFDSVVARALAKEPSERFSSAGELGRAAVSAAEQCSVSEEEANWTPFESGSESERATPGDSTAPTAA